MTRKISATTLDTALANLSDLPTVIPAYDLGYGGDAAGLAIRFPNSESDDPKDPIRFFLDLARADEALAEEFFEALYVDRPSYRGNVFVFEGYELEGESAYTTDPDLG